MEKKEYILARFSELNLTQKAVAERLGGNQPQVSAYINGTRKFGVKVAQKWSDAFGFNVQWLLTGEGPMLKNQMMSGSTISISDVITSGRDTNIGHDKDADNLRTENATLKNEIKHLESENQHLNELIKEKDARIMEKERIITFLIDDKMKKS